MKPCDKRYWALIWNPFRDCLDLFTATDDWFVAWNCGQAGMEIIDRETDPLSRYVPEVGA